MEQTEKDMPVAGHDSDAPRTGADVDHGELDRAAASVLRAQTPRELKRATAELTATAAPRDLEAALGRSYRPLAHGLVELFAPFLSHGSARRRAMRWQRRALGELRGWADSGSWRASQIGPNATFFSNPEVPNSEKTLVIGIAGNSLQLMASSYQILRALRSQRADLLLLRDPEKKFFAGRVAGLGEDPQEVAMFAEAFSQKGGYRRTIALATSAGGLFGIYAALLNGWERAVAIGPDNPESHPGLRDRLKDLAERVGPPPATPVRICYAAGNAHNREGAESIAGILPTATLVATDGPDQHNLLESLAETGELDAYLRLHCFDEKSV